jgi:hypothetical protein
MSPADTDPLRDVLTRVAAGELDPAEAARLLDEGDAPRVDRVDLSPTPPVSSITALTVLAGGVKLTVVADPTVATAVADGPHSTHQEGTTLVIEAPGGEGWQVREAPKYLGWVPTLWTGGRGERVTVRVNPDLATSIDSTASSVEVTGLHADLSIRAQASSVKVREHRGALHGSSAASSVSFIGVVTGPSSFVNEFGSLDVRLAPGSDVVVDAVSEMGSLKLGDAKAIAEDNGMKMRGTTGTGSHAFDITTRMGSASVVAL